MTTAPDPALAAVIFDLHEPVDDVVMAAITGLGLPVMGYLQSHQENSDCACDDMIVTSLHGGPPRNITQKLGPQSQGCRLDTAALAEVAGWLEADLARGCPGLLVLNRFGKVEAEGGGLRAALEQALERGIPVLAPVNRKHLDFWRDYSGGMAEELPCDAAAIRAWLDRATTPPADPARAAIAAAAS